MWNPTAHRIIREQSIAGAGSLRELWTRHPFLRAHFADEDELAMSAFDACGLTELAQQLQADKAEREAERVNYPRRRTCCTDGTLNFFIYGQIGDGGFSAKHFEAAIEQHQPAALTLWIDSRGGSMLDCRKICQRIRAYGANSTAIIERAAYSAAANIAITCRHRIMRPEAVLMIHGLQIQFTGTLQLLRESLRSYEDRDRETAHAIADRCKLNVFEVAQMMQAETYLSAADALKLGMVDAIEPERKAGGLRSIPQILECQ